ncbi:MAG: DNA internalization-related competence protein ComEC/Rec2 [Vicinamibacterales bacterium]
MRVPASLVAIPLLAGAASGILLADTAPEHLVLASACAAVLCLLSAAGFHAEGMSGAVVIGVVAGAAAAGYANGASHARLLDAPSILAWFDTHVTPDADPAVLSGTLRDDGAHVGYGVLLTLDVREVGIGSGQSSGVSGGVRLTVGGEAPATEVSQWRAGREVRVPATLRRPVTFRNPGVPDEARAMARRGIALTGSVKSAALVEVVARGSWLSERAAFVRAWARRLLSRHVGRYDPRSAAVATAILVGDRTGLSDEDERRLQEAGTYHVIAISGGNIAILAGLLVVGARALRLPARTGAALAILVLLFYGEIAGGTPSVGRAITAAVIFLTALLIDHRGAPLNVLAVAAVLAVAVSPLAVMDGGFLLSFGATAGIILGVPRLVTLAADHRVRGVARIVRMLVTAAAGVLAATVCSEVVLAPVGASLFSRVTFAGLVLNFAAIPLMTAVQCGSMALLLAVPLHASTADALGAVVHYAAFGLVESSRLVELAPWVARSVPPPAWWLCVVYYALCVGWLLATRRRRLALAGIVVAMAVLVSGRAPAAAGLPRSLPAGALRVVMLDVGQGDATVAILPDGRAVLIDAGGLAGTTFDMGGRVVLPALRALGVRRLHALVLTHGDPDHIDGAAAVMRRLTTATVWEGVPVPPHPGLRALMAQVAGQRASWRTVRPGDVELAGGVEIRILHPPAPDWERQRVRNDDSVVIELRYRDVSILLPGDIGAGIERALIPALDLRPVVILKAAHHGSATSSSEAFIEATNPRAVVFSAGRNNRFGHPAPSVVERFARRGVEMFHTAHDGAVFVETDGKSATVTGWHTGRRLFLHEGLKEHQEH